jgi:predicted ribosome quality control (RQC) complex YloA/Tae2 family protein
MEEIERLRTSGELILAYASQIKPEQQTLAAETDAGVIEIHLDSKMTAVENAQKYFKDYHRAKDAAARVPALLAAASMEVEYADQMLSDLEFAGNRAEIDAVVLAARKAGLLTIIGPRARALPLSEPRVYQSRDGFAILVGKNARQNEEITFRRARADDLWLHARNAAGAHIVIVGGGREVPESTIEEAAGLAARYSQARADIRVDVIVTPRKNVRRVRGGRTGMVTVRGERTVTVTPSNRIS